MRERSAAQWGVGDLVDALARHRWLPDRDDAGKRVTDMAGVMVSEGQLDRPSRGVYMLKPELALASEGASSKINFEVLLRPSGPSDKE